MTIIVITISKFNQNKILGRISSVYRDYKSSYEKLLDQAKLQSLHLGRLRSLATEIHKAVHGGGPLPMSALFSQRENLNTALEGTTL